MLEYITARPASSDTPPEDENKRPEKRKLPDPAALALFRTILCIVILVIMMIMSILAPDTASGAESAFCSLSQSETSADAILEKAGRALAEILYSEPSAE